MFSKNSRTSEVAAAQPQSRPRSGRAAPSIISADMVLVGNITAGGDIQIDGTVEGDIHSTSLTIGDKATINGEIIADEVVVRGRVMGSIRARRVQLCSTCHVEGNILHEALAVETGAFFEGNCRHSPDPLAEDSQVGHKGGRSPLLGDPKKTGNAASRGGILGGLVGSKHGLGDEFLDDELDDD